MRYKHYLPMQNIICQHRKLNNLCNYLIYNLLQNFLEGQKSIRGTGRGLYFCKETNKICKNSLFLGFLAYLHFVAWLNRL